MALHSFHSCKENFSLIYQSKEIQQYLFCKNGLNKVMKMHVESHGSTVGKMQFEKVVMYSCEWSKGQIHSNNGMVHILNDKINKLNVDQSIKTQGV